MPKSPLRTAIVGCGRVSRTAHYGAVRENPDFVLKAVCDVDEARATKAAEDHDAVPFFDIDAMLGGEELDLVAICAPNGLHCDLAARVVRHGIPVLVEKPLGMALPEVDTLLRDAAHRRVPIFSVLQNRFNATNQLVWRAMRKGRFGQLLLANVTMRWRRDMPYYLEDDGWRGRRDMAGGAFTNQAIHYVDTMQWLIGAPPEFCFARMGTATLPVEVETHGCATIKFRNGVIGSLDLNVRAFDSDREGSITLQGERGTVKIGGKSMNRVLEWDFADEDPDDDAAAAAADYEPPTVYGFGHNEVYRRIGQVLRHGKPDPDLPTGHEGRKSVELLNGLYLSDARAEVVRFPLMSG